MVKRTHRYGSFLVADIPTTKQGAGGGGFCVLLLCRRLLVICRDERKDKKCSERVGVLSKKLNTELAGGGVAPSMN